jgi:hypothetical protein
MELYDLVIAEFPELATMDHEFYRGTIELRDESDGSGAFIAKWEYSKPLPKSLRKYLRNETNKL